jgi:hypothetical protein
VVSKVRAHAVIRHHDVDAQCVEVGLGADSAAEQDCRRPARACSEHDHIGTQHLRAGNGGGCTLSLEEHAVDQRICADGQILAFAGGIEVGERRIPAHTVRHVERSDTDSERTRVVVQVTEQG